MFELKIACFICGAGVGTICRVAGRIGAERFASHAGRVVVSQLVATGMSVDVATRTVRS